jgi:hypothetical protein
MNLRFTLPLIPLVLVACGTRRSSLPAEPLPGARAPSENVMLQVSPDGTIREQGTILYDPETADASSLDRFMAAQRAKDPLVPVILFAGPDVSIDKIERASNLSGANLVQRGPISFKISGWVQSSFRTH